MHLVIMGEPAKQLIDNGPGIRPRVHSDVIALEGADERFRHTVRLWAADRCGPRHQADVAGKGMGITRCVSATVFMHKINANQLG